MDSLLEFLFKYRPFAFAKGALAFAAPIPLWALVLAGAAAVALSIWPYVRGGALRTSDRITLSVLRAFAVALVVWCIARPVLVLSESVTQRNVVGIVVDDSRSMQVADVDAKSRGSVVSRLAGGADSALIRALSERYQVRVFRTSSGGRLQDASSIRYDASRTRLASSLLRVEDDLAGTPTAGLILLSDGADNSSGVAGERTLTEQLLALRARHVPVYSVGIGGERLAKDIELSRVEAPRAVLRDASLFVEAVVVQRGFGGSKIPVVVEDSGRIVGSTTVTLPRDGEAVPVRIRIPASETGARLLRINIPVQAGELIKENNERFTLVVVRDRREKVLYLEGEPRWEVKFLRKAVESDGNVQLVTLLRSAKDKYLRLGVDDSLELATGFPKTREELFSYRAIVLGSIEASFFTADQLRMLADFASERGGGILFLGGREALGEGGYGGTAVSDVLPIDVLGNVGDPEKVLTVHAELTPAGATHAALQIAPGDSSSAARWSALPPLTTVNRIGRAKPGATVLLNGKEEGEGGTVRPLLAYQRYGRGKSIVFASQDDWIWQMDATINPEDMTHETFWRQMLRWLLSDVPDRAEASVAEESGPGEAVTVRAEVSDAAYLKANGATVRGTVRAPSGKTQDVSLEWGVDHDGEYRTTYVPDENGVHVLELQAVVGGGRDTLHAEPAYVRVAAPTTEFFGSEMRSTLLRQISEETGGRYYTPERATDIARDMVYSASGATVVEKRDLWDMPMVFALMMMALGGEWLLRRRRGLA